MSGTQEAGEGDHMCGDVSGRGEDERPPQYHPHQAVGRHFGLQSAEFLTPGSRGRPAQLLKARLVPAGVEFAETSQLTTRSEVAGKEHLKSDRWSPPNLLPS